MQGAVKYFVKVPANEHLERHEKQPNQAAKKVRE